MAFLLYKVDDGHNLPIEYLPAGTITPKVGTMLVQSSGKLALATGTTKPTYVSLYEAPAQLADGTIIPVARVDHSQIYETVLYNDASAVDGFVRGAKATIHTDGAQITKTLTSGVAEIIELADGVKTAGAKVRVRF